MEKHRNLSYLEQLLEDINRAEQDRFEVKFQIFLCFTVVILIFETFSSVNLGVGSNTTEYADWRPRPSARRWR